MDVEQPVHVVELIPGEDFVMFVGTEPPDADVVRQLRMQAYQRRNKETLSAGQAAAHALQTLAEFAASGVVGNAAYDAFPLVKRWILGWTAARRTRRVDAIRAMELGRSACARALHSTPMRCVAREVLPFDEGDGWRLEFDADGELISVGIDGSGGIIAVKIHESSDND